MSEIDTLQKEIRDQFGPSAAAMMDTLDNLRRTERLPLLRKLIQLETTILQKHIEDLKAILPLEDRP